MKSVAIIVNIGLFFFLLFCSAAALMTPMMFDAPGSENNLALKITALATVTLPITLIVVQVFSWITFVKGNYKKAVWISLLPVIIHIGIIVTGWILVSTNG